MTGYRMNRERPVVPPPAVARAIKRLNHAVAPEPVVPFKAPLTVETIQRLAADYFQIPLIDMRSHRRGVARQRQVAMYLARYHTVRSLPEIGRMFGGRDHTTVIHAVNRINQLRQVDGELEQDIRALEARLP